MKKLTLSLLLLISAFASAQERSYLAVSVGPALPIGNFGVSGSSNFFNYQIPGFAKTGYHFEADGTKFFSPNFGISGMVGMAENNFDKTAYESYYNGSAIPALSSYMSNQNVNSDYNIKNYYHVFAMVGPTIGYKQDKVSVDARFLMGALYTTYPNLEYTITSSSVGYYNGQSFNQLTVEKGSAAAPAVASLALSLGAVFRYKIAANMSFLFKTEYIWASQGFNPKTTHSVVSNDPNLNSSYQYYSNQLSSVEKDVSVTLFNIGMGLGYEF
jgi:hypothetical protein